MTERFPLEPLAHAAGVTLGQIGAHQPGDPMAGLTALASLTGYSVTTLKRARSKGGFRAVQADRAAVRCGLHPGRVWPSWWGVAEADQAVAGEVATALSLVDRGMRPVVRAGSIVVELAA